MKKAIRWVLYKFLILICWPVNYCIMMPLITIGSYISKDNYTIVQAIRGAHNELMDEYRVTTT